MRILVLPILAAAAVTLLAAAGEAPQPPAAALSVVIDDVLRRNIFDPAVLATESYAKVRTEAAALDQAASDPKAFAEAYNRLWQAGPTSHVRLTPAHGTAEATAAMLDAMEAGPKALSLEWRGDVAILTINTMMGSDTIARVHASMAEVAARPARGLIVDLRSNGGGAFVGVALAAHLIQRPHDAGAFYSRKWTRAHRAPPPRAAVNGLSPWTGWSIRSFWRDVVAAPVTRVQFQPAAPHFGGPVYVLTSRRTASAAEMTADALAASAGAILVGERTAGQMLSQMPFDLPQGLQLYAPIASYVSWRAGVIESRGIEPHIPVAAPDALATALARFGADRAAAPPGAVDPAIDAARAAFLQWADAFRAGAFRTQWLLTHPRIRYWRSAGRWSRGMRAAQRRTGGLAGFDIDRALRVSAAQIPCTEHGHCYREDVDYVLFTIRSRYHGARQPPQPEYAVMAMADEGWRFAGGTFPFRPLGETAVLLNAADERRYRALQK